MNIYNLFGKANRSDSSEDEDKDKYKPRADKYTFWLERPSILYKNKNYIRFYPTYGMTRQQQMNAVTRFSVYLMLFLIMIKKEDDWLYLPLTIFLTVVAVYFIHREDILADRKDLIRERRQRDEKELEEKKINRYITGKTKDDKKELKGVIDFDEFEVQEEDNDLEIETGYYDNEGRLIMGKPEGPPKSLIKNTNLLGEEQDKEDFEDLNKVPELKDIPYNIDDLIEYEKNTCRRPTMDNPFMNPKATEYGANLDLPAACNAMDEEINDEIKDFYDHNLYRDVEDIWEKKNSERQFYTLPNTRIPNDQEAFANWLYKTGDNNCKINQNCLRFEDLRFKR